MLSGAVKLVQTGSNSNSRICSAPPTVSPKVHYIVCHAKKKRLQMAFECCCRRPRVSVLSVGDSIHEVRRQRMHGHQFAIRFLVGRFRRCCRRAVKSVMECWREQLGDVVRRLTKQGLVHEETQFVLNSWHDRKPM